MVAQNGPLGQGNPTLIVEANFKIHQKINVIPLALKGKIAAIVGFAEQCRPLGCFHQRFQLFRGIPRRIKPPHNGPHAGAGDAIDGNTLFFQNLQNAHVGNAQGPAAGKNQTGFRLCRRNDG